jgi:hypothetical protein
MDTILSKALDQIYFKSLIARIPDYYAGQTVEYAYQVNDISIKSYDIKRDEPFLIRG